MKVSAIGALVDGLRLILLTILFSILFVFSGELAIPTPPASQATADASSMLAVLPIVGLIYTATLSYLTVRSRWRGPKLALAIFVIFFGIYTFLSQIETLAFPAVLNRMPPGTVQGLVLMGLLIAAPFSLAFVIVYGKWRKDAAATAIANQPNERLVMPLSEWIWKLALVVVLYEIVYFTFGYFVAWRTPGLPEFYGGTDPGNFFAQIGNVIRDTPWLPALQIGRALIWAGIGLIIIRMLKGGALETCLAVGVSFSLLMCGSMLLPNPYMPEVVMRAHTIELLSSNFLFGFLLAGLMLWRPGHRQSISTPTVHQAGGH